MPTNCKALGLLSSLTLMVVLGLIAILIFYGVASEIRDGIVHHKGGGMSSKIAAPIRFWLDIAIQSAMGIALVGAAIATGYGGIWRRG